MNKHHLVWSVFSAAFLLSTIFSADPLLSICGRYYAGWENGVLILLCWLAFEMGAANPDVKTLSRWMTVSGLLGAAYLCIQRAGLDPWTWYGGAGNVVGRSMGFGGEPVYSGALVALAMTWMPTWCLPFSLFAIFCTGSRAAVLAAAAGASYWVWVNRPKERSFLVAAWALLIFIVSHIHRVASDVGRLAQNWVALLAFAQRPILGWGPSTGVIWFLRCRDSAAVAMMGGTMDLCAHSHNLITNVAATQGIVGLLAWTLLCGGAWRVSASASRAALLSMFVFGMFEPIPHVAYVVLAMAVGIDVGGA